MNDEQIKRLLYFIFGILLGLLIAYCLIVVFMMVFLNSANGIITNISLIINESKLIDYMNNSMMNRWK